MGSKYKKTSQGTTNNKEQLIKDMAVRDLILKDMGILQPDMINPKAEKPKKPERTDKQILNSKF